MRAMERVVLEVAEITGGILVVGGTIFNLTGVAVFFEEPLFPLFLIGTSMCIVGVVLLHVCMSLANNKIG